MILGSFGAKPSKAIIKVIKAGQSLFNNNKTEEIAPLMIKCFGQQMPESHKKLMIEQFRGMSKEQFLSFYEHCDFVEQATDIEDFAILSNIKASTLIVSGEFDAILDINDVKDASSKIPDCEYRMIPGAGHFLHWEQPKILHTYSEFLAR